MARPETMKALSRALAIASFGAAIFLLWECFFHSAEKDFGKMMTQMQNSASSVRVSHPAPAKTKDLSSYEALVSEKSLFQISSGRGTAVVAASGQNAPPNSFQDIALVGLLPGDVPQAILENQKTQKTYYLSPYQSSEGIAVDEIRGQSVTISSGDEKKTLTL